MVRSTYYYEAKIRDDQDEELTDLILNIFKKSRNNYGQRKIKVEVKKMDWIVSRSRIGRIMKEQGLVSKYTVAQFNPSKSSCNDSEVGNALNRAFDQDQELKVVVSDLTYVRVGQKRHYITMLIQLTNHSETEVQQLMKETNNNIKLSLIIAKANCDITDARKCLSKQMVTLKRPLNSQQIVKTVFRPLIQICEQCKIMQ
ncbi:HTH-like domain-containing protein [Gracilibacillus kekensis]|uniref:HTH-like domain-containing protein n=1 Tax=Gracilibacillus kekensis TaxID=1027249 RepID=A0A1M7QTL2_9BACI|nr:HTH-like domain-containing protein [Gracilibacillus kekensis]